MKRDDLKKHLTKNKWESLYRVLYEPFVIPDDCTYCHKLKQNCNSLNMDGGFVSPGCTEQMWQKWACDDLIDLIKVERDSNEYEELLGVDIDITDLIGGLNV